MRHPPTVPGSVTLLLALVGALLLSPAAAHSGVQGTEPETLPAFYARMLKEHDGVFVEEELAGYFHREEVMADLRALLERNDARISVLVVYDPYQQEDMDLFARSISRAGGRPTLILSPRANQIWASRTELDRIGGGLEIPYEAVQYTFYTGTYPEDPRDQLARLVRAARYPDLEERTRIAQVEYAHATEGRYPVAPGNSAVPGFPTQRWLTVKWVVAAGFVAGLVAVWIAVPLVVRSVRRWRERPGKVAA